MMSLRALFTTVGDLLAVDACLIPLLDEDGSTQHGSEDFCDQPITSHRHRAIRRVEQGWPGDFQQAVVCYGGFTRSPYQVGLPKGVEAWVFRVSIWTHNVVTLPGISTAGDLHAADIYDQVTRILGWQDIHLPCDSSILIGMNEHDGDAQSLAFLNEKSAWSITMQFRWGVVSRGIVAPAEPCPYY